MQVLAVGSVPKSHKIVKGGGGFLGAHGRRVVVFGMPIPTEPHIHKLTGIPAAY